MLPFCKLSECWHANTAQWFVAKKTGIGQLIGAIRRFFFRIMETGRFQNYFFFKKARQYLPSLANS